ncbi:single-stranded DNA-binding protein [Streptomyces sp. NBC_01483]|uniref:single-stranded DNA-binding protein n=1 Tax=Streptomyces sp. NBC_01483 TaxID=2903883 RepID=UPI002E35ED73|nr:single-stranded DNA-binding protein [Streptomyces sp. NBC_01483]
MSGETVITVVGNLVDDVELRFVSSGAAVAKFRIASTPRTFDKQANEWRDGESLFLTCSVWRQAAENVAESLTRGMRVIVQGRLKQRSYEKDGAKHTVYELDVEEVGPSLRSATAKVTKASSGNSGQGGGRQEYVQARQQQSAGSGDPWGAAAQSAGQAAGSWSGDEPPF